jgi:hypothetical protein
MMSTQKCRFQAYLEDLQYSFAMTGEVTPNDITPMFPVVILFCNGEYEEKGDLKNIVEIFDAEGNCSYDVTEGALPGFEVVNALAQHVFDIDGVRLDKVILLNNANEEGFKKTRQLHYFDYQYIVNNAKEHTLLQNLVNAAEKHTSAQCYAHALEDKLTGIFDDMYYDFECAEISTEMMLDFLTPIKAVKNADDLLGGAIAKMFENFRRV